MPKSSFTLQVASMPGYPSLQAALSDNVAVLAALIKAGEARRLEAVNPLPPQTTTTLQPQFTGTAHG